MDACFPPSPTTPWDPHSGRETNPQIVLTSTHGQWHARSTSMYMLKNFHMKKGREEARSQELC